MVLFKRKDRYDVVVVGGGVAGWVAAVSAARNGAETLLIERYGFLGGSATASLVGPWMRYSSRTEQLITGIFEEFRQRLDAIGGVRKATFDYEKYKFVAQEMVMQSGADLLFHSWFQSCTVHKGLITDIAVLNKSGIHKIGAGMVIDATGDGDVAAAAGVPFTVGREKDGLTQAMTLMFTVGGVDFGRVFTYLKDNPDDYLHWKDDVNYETTGVLCRAGFYKAVKKAKEAGMLDESVPYLFFISIPTDNIVVFNTTHVHKLNPLDPWDLTEAEVRLRRQVWQVVTLLKELPGFENSYLVETAPQVGVRETRHFEGQYTFTGEDVRKARKFDDVIARGNYGIDVHAPDDSEEFEVEEQEDYQTYDIPFRSLIPVNIENLLLAGRCISADHLGESAMRIQPICMAIGEAAGSAAAVCVNKKTLPQKLDVKTLQNLLVAQGANLGKHI